MKYFNVIKEKLSIKVVESENGKLQNVKHINPNMPTTGDQKYRLLYNLNNKNRQLNDRMSNEKAPEDDSGFKVVKKRQKRRQTRYEKDDVINALYGEGQQIPIPSFFFNELLRTGCFTELVDSSTDIKFLTNRQNLNFLGNHSLNIGDSWIMECKVETKIFTHPVDELEKQKSYHVLQLLGNYGTEVTYEQKIIGAILPHLLTSTSPIGLPLSVDEAVSRFSTYKIQTWNFDSSSLKIDVHFNSEMDGFIFGNKSVEIKAVKCLPTGEAILKPEKAFKILKQCETGGIDFVVIGYHHNNQLVLTELYSYEEMHKFVYKIRKQYKNDMEKIQNFKNLNIKKEIKKVLEEIFYKMATWKRDVIYIGKALNSKVLDYDMDSTALATRIDEANKPYINTE